MFSGGHSSGVTALNVADRYGTGDMILLNHNISGFVESADIKRFKKEVAAHLQLPITYANIKGISEESELPDQFQVCVDAGAIVNPRTFDAICTSRLKTEPFYAFLAEKFPAGGDASLFPAEDVILYYGFDKKEMHRVNRRSQLLGMMGYKTDFPSALWDEVKFTSTHQIGIIPPATYELWLHANCIGCLKSGLLHWYVVYVHRPDIYARGVWMEEETGYTVHSIIRKGVKIKISLEELAVYFENMKQSGVPATEHQPPLKFARSLDKYKIAACDPGKPCSCTE